MRKWIRDWLDKHLTIEEQERRAHDRMMRLRERVRRAEHALTDAVAHWESLKLRLRGRK